MASINLQARLAKLEKAPHTCASKQAVVLIADGHSPKQISDFLLSRGIVEGPDQPIIIIQGKLPTGQLRDNPQRPLEVL